jgi:magnesium chelatase subunit D
MRGDPRKGYRLHLPATLKTAAPWQTLRRGTIPEERAGKLQVRADDFRVVRFKSRQPVTRIFVVDASGSAAAQRLAETKGAIELLLAESYVTRDQVALVAFRGTGAELLLPPTRALARAKRELAGLPGGGGTPLATGLHAAWELARDLERKGQHPVLILMTDGRANVCLDGSTGHEAAGEEALQAARQLRAAGWDSLVVDTVRRPRPRARAIAEAMGARYLPLPQAQSGGLSAAASELETTA